MDETAHQSETDKYHQQVAAGIRAYAEEKGIGRVSVRLFGGRNPTNPSYADTRPATRTRKHDHDIAIVSNEPVSEANVLQYLQKQGIPIDHLDLMAYTGPELHDMRFFGGENDIGLSASIRLGKKL